MSIKHSKCILLSCQERRVHIRTYARAYSWNLFQYQKALYPIKPGWQIYFFSHYIGVPFLVFPSSLLFYQRLTARNAIVGWEMSDGALLQFCTVIISTRTLITIDSVATEFALLKGRRIALCLKPPWLRHCFTFPVNIVPYFTDN